MLNRFKWLLLVPAFVLVYRVLLHFYWLPQRRAFIAHYRMFSPAYGDGQVDAQAIIGTAAPVLISVVCLLLLRAPHFAVVMLAGAFSAFAGFGLQLLCAPALGAIFGLRVARHVPIAFATVLAIVGCILLNRWKTFRASTPDS